MVWLAFWIDVLASMAKVSSCRARPTRTVRPSDDAAFTRPKTIGPAGGDPSPGGVAGCARADAARPATRVTVAIQPMIRLTGILLGAGEVMAGRAPSAGASGCAAASAGPSPARPG